jgi:beta-D-xylosidase 4
MRSTLTPAALLALFIASSADAIGPDCVNGPLATNKICDRGASPPERAAALVAAMEDTEKLDNLMR